MNKHIIDALNETARIAAQAGEGIVFGVFPADNLRDETIYTARLDCPGTSGISGRSTKGWGAALVDALANRSEEEKRQRIKAQVEAEVEERMNTLRAAA